MGNSPGQPLPPPTLEATQHSYILFLLTGHVPPHLKGYGPKVPRGPAANPSPDLHHLRDGQPSPQVGVAPHGLGSYKPKDSFLSPAPPVYRAQKEQHKASRSSQETLWTAASLSNDQILLVRNTTPLLGTGIHSTSDNRVGGVACPVSLWSLALPSRRICFVYSPLHSLI